MVDLKELDKEIDTLLAGETVESLTLWLKSQEEINFEKYLGKGKIILAKRVSCIMEFASQNPTISYETGKTDEKAGNYSFAMAA